MMGQLVETNRSLPDLGSIQEKVVAKRFDDALTDLAEILRAEPDNPDALYMAAVCCRYTRDFESALEHISKLKTIVGRTRRKATRTGTWSVPTMRCSPTPGPAASTPP
jgi:tetratricopeptide (TPR) repeat protein